MKKLMLFLMAIVVSIVSFNACTDYEMNEVEEVQPNLKSTSIEEWTKVNEAAWYYSTTDLNVEFCDTADEYPFFNSASVAFFNDENFLYVNIKPYSGWSIRELSVAIWSSDDTPNNEYRDFPYRKSFASQDVYPNLLSYKIPYDETWGECFKVSLKLMTYDGTGYDWYWLTTDNEKSVNYPINYCWKDCNPCPPQKIGDLKLNKHKDVGDIHSWEDNEYVYVKYELNDEYQLKNAHAIIGSYKNMYSKTKKPNLKRYMYKIKNLEEGILMIPLSDLNSVKKDKNGCWPIITYGMISKTKKEKKEKYYSWKKRNYCNINRFYSYARYCPCE